MGHPAEAGNESEVARRVRRASTRRKKPAHPSIVADAEAAGRHERLSVLQAFSLLVPKRQHEPTRVSESLPPTLVASPPKWRRDGTDELTRTPKQRPGARHATRKLMAPPLRFFVLPAFLSLGSRCVPVCLTDTIRSRGFSPSQRFHPARALRLCFAPLPPLGFLASRAFPTQPAVTPFDALCSFVVSSSSGLERQASPPHRPSFPLSADWRPKAVPCHEASVQLDKRPNITACSKGRSPTKNGSGHTACRGLTHSDSSRSSAALHRSSGTISSWRGMPTLERCSN